MAREYPEEIDKRADQAAVAATRLGYGLIPGQMNQLYPDPKPWLMAQVEQGGRPSPRISRRSNEILIEMLALRANGRKALQDWRVEIRQKLDIQLAEYLTAMLESRTPFLDRLVRFWSDHFLLNMNRPAVMPLVLAFEEEAIRPNVTRGFYTMLLAIVRHPAMLIYLDNVRSVGSRSDAGRRTGRGPELRMAETLLTQFTYGPGAAVQEIDIVNLARMLTGWTVGAQGSERPGSFVFREDWHDPGPKRFEDVVIPDAADLQAEAALDKIVRAPVTAQHLGLKLAQYLRGAGVAKGTGRELASGFTGDGGPGGMARKVVNLPSMLAYEQEAYKSPMDLVMSLHRAFGRNDGEAALRDLRAMGQVPFQMQDGTRWPDGSLAWASNGQFLDRLSWIADFAGRTRIPGSLDAIDFGFEILGPLLRRKTYRLMRVANGEAEALTLLLSSPEFLRR